eukprot:4372418-Pleurochrysis_carterae.AAC.1
MATIERPERARAARAATQHPPTHCHPRNVTHSSNDHPPLPLRATQVRTECGQQRATLAESAHDGADESRLQADACADARASRRTGGAAAGQRRRRRSAEARKRRMGTRFDIAEAAKDSRVESANRRAVTSASGFPASDSFKEAVVEREAFEWVGRM